MFAEVLCDIINTTASYPVWQPTVRVTVQPNGNVLTSIEGYANPFLSVRRTL